MSNLPFAKKALGQHWLSDAGALGAMVTAASIGADDYVFEIGPGAGTLTATLLETGAQVMALEFDVQLILALTKRFANRPNFQVEPGDVRTFDLSTLPTPYKLVANIPYYLTANLLRKLIDTAHKPAVAALLVQKEVAERVAAGAGRLSFIAVLTQLHYEVSLGEVVPAELFTPPPKVDSQVLILKQRTTPLFNSLETEQFIKVVKAGFSAPRKKLRSSLSGGLGVSKEAAEQQLAGAGLDPNARAQQLSLDDWYQLYTATK